ncbi:hypothetical protein CO641_02430 [Lysobacteraceae bacterium NML91-0213]|nr:hypothetical protein CO641_02430 [Xanthomonadaceae bacterium NML91-0213]
MMDRLEEAIRIVLETRGREGVDQLRDALAGVGDVSAETKAETDGLLDSLNELNETATRAERFEALTREIGGTEEKLAAASRAALQLSLQLGATEKPSRELQTAQRAAREEVDRLEQSLEKQYQALEKADRELGQLGFNTADLAAGQAQLRNEIGRTTTALERQTGSVRREADARAQLAQRLEEGDEQFRKLARSGQMSADALEAYRARAAAAEGATKDLGDAGNSVTGIFRRLGPLITSVFGFFSVRGMVSGLRSIVREGSEAEQELGQLNAVLASTGRQAEFAGGELQALAENLARTSRFSAGEIINAETRLLSYTNIMREQFPQAMQIVVDQSARLNMSLEQSAETVGRALQTPTKAMEALGRQGFVLEDSQKRLLAQLEATGQTAKAQAIIMDLLVESYGGAATAQKVGTIAGLWKGLQETFRDFQTDVANRGVFDYLKKQLSDLAAALARMGRDGTLALWAQRVADSIVRTGEAAKNFALQLRPVGEAVLGFTQVLARHVDQVILLAKVYATLKLAQLASQFAALTSAKLANLAATKALTAANIANAASSALVGRSVAASGTAASRAAQQLLAAGTTMGRLRQLMLRIPRVVRFTVAGVGLDLAIRQMTKLAEVLKDRQLAAKQQEAFERTQRELQREQLALGQQLQNLYRDSAETAIKSAEELNGLTRDQGEAYRYSLNEATRYWEGVVREARAAGDAVAAAAAHERWKALLGALTEVDDFLARGGISAGARRVANEIQGIEGNARLAAEQIGKLFEDIDLTDTEAVRDLAAGLMEVARRGEESARAMEQGLRQSLARLSGEDLLRFQTAAQEAFAGFDVLPAEAARVIDSTLLAGLQRLGVATSRLGFDFTDAGEDAIAAFTAVAQNANATGAQIEAAFKAALDRASTVAEVERLGEVLQQVGGKGALGFQQAERAGAALENRIRQLKNAIDPLNDAFSQLGITSQAELERARDAAKAAFDQIARGAREGTASVADTRRAFQAYAQAARAAVAESAASARARVEAELKVMDAVFNVTAGMKGLGEAGEVAGERVASGAAVAASGLDSLASTAQRTAREASAAASAVEDTAGAIAAAGSASARGATQAEGMSVALGGLSDEAMRALSSLNKYAGLQVWQKLWNRTMDEVIAQQEAVARMTDEMDRQAAAADPLARELEKLRRQYNLVDESQLSALAQKQVQHRQRIAAARDEAQREVEEARRERDALRKEAMASQPASSTGNAPVQGARPLGTIRIELPDGSAEELLTDDAGAESVSRMLQALERSRAITTRRRR